MTQYQEGALASLAKAISSARARRQQARSQWLEEVLEAHSCFVLNIGSREEVATVTSLDRKLNADRIWNILKKLRSGAQLPLVDESGFFNHSNPTLSALDLQMIRSVPEGGNWQNIPESVPSARLEQIREMTRARGVVRTTYYGRLRRDQPSYTISTYFNRPGNGTHIHPLLDRTLTAREAARLQSFPDSYVFMGNDGAVRNQIGNAVPPLLARALGQHLLNFGTERTCVDAFCGAGGLSSGLEAAGWKPICAIDNDSSALQTYAVNRPSSFECEVETSNEVTVLKRDFHDPNSISGLADYIKRRLAGRRLGLLAGGPPCQGFSHAGFRNSDDRRNDLAVGYLKLAAELRPEIVVLENVEGLLSFNGGQTVIDICKTLEELGYRVASPVWKLGAEEYGVPQMRRRVFIVAISRATVEIAPPPTTHEKCYGRWAAKAQRPSGFGTPLNKTVTVSQAFAGLSLPETHQSPDYDQWLNWRAI